MTGLPVIDAIDSAAPPRASPSSLVSTTPSYPTPSRNACAVATASWPIIASTTNSTSSGTTASRMSAACCISSASTPSRPAVSTMTTSCRVRRASSRPTLRDRHRVADAVAGLGCEDGDPGALTVDLELVDRVGPLQVGRDEQRADALLLEPQRELGRERRLAGTLEAGQHDHGRRGLREAQPAGLAAEDRDQLLVDDLDDLLRRVERAADLLAAGPLLDGADELLDHGQRDVGLEQRDPDLACRGVDVGVGEPSLAAEVLEGVGEPVGERGKHGGVQSSGVDHEGASHAQARCSRVTVSSSAARTACAASAARVSLSAPAPLSCT